MKNNERRNTDRLKAWRAMRGMGKFTISEVATIAGVRYENIKHYTQCLVKAGYVRQIGTRTQQGRSGFDKVHRLVRNTGPKPPIQKSLRFLYDPNTKEYWAEDPEVMAAAIKPSEAVLPKAVHMDGIKKIRVKVKPGSPLDMVEKK